MFSIFRNCEHKNLVHYREPTFQGMRGKILSTPRQNFAPKQFKYWKQRSKQKYIKTMDSLPKWVTRRDALLNEDDDERFRFDEKDYIENGL